MRPRSSCSFIANPHGLGLPSRHFRYPARCVQLSFWTGREAAACRERVANPGGGLHYPSAAVLVHDTCHPAIRHAVLRKFDILGRCVGASDNTLPPPAPTSRHIADPPGQRPPRTPFLRSITPQ